MWNESACVVQFILKALWFFYWNQKSKIFQESNAWDLFFSSSTLILYIEQVMCSITIHGTLYVCGFQLSIVWIVFLLWSVRFQFIHLTTQHHQQQPQQQQIAKIRKFSYQTKKKKRKKTKTESVQCSHFSKRFYCFFLFTGLFVPVVSSHFIAFSFLQYTICIKMFLCAFTVFVLSKVFEEKISQKHTNTIESSTM